MTRKITLVVVATTLAVLAMSSTAWAVVSVRMSLDDLVREAQVVVRGKVVSSMAFMDEELGRVSTRHTISVSETLRGTPVAEVAVVTMGGELEEIGQLVPGEAKLSAGEEVVLCLKKVRSADWAVVAMSQGKFSVTKRESKEILVRDMRGTLLLGEGEPKSPGIEEIGMDEFRRMLERLGE